MGFNEASTFVKIAFVLIPIQVILQLLGLATSYWYSGTVYMTNNYYSEYHHGIWLDYPPSWLEAVQAFETLGFIAGLAALVLIILYIFVPATSGRKIVFILCMLACFIAAGCIILGIIIYGSKMSNLSWSFALCTIAGIIFGISGVLLLVDTFKR